MISIKRLTKIHRINKKEVDLRLQAFKEIKFIII